MGRIIPAELGKKVSRNFLEWLFCVEKAILKSLEEGKLPFFINATSGTTVLGNLNFLAMSSKPIEVRKKNINNLIRYLNF